MATNNLKFFHVAGLPSTGAVTGGIYFDKTAGELAVWNGTAWERYSGNVKNVSYDPVVDSKGNAVGGKLTITYFDGSNVELDFSDVASKQDVINRIATALQDAKDYSNARKINGLTGHDITLTGANVKLDGYKKADTSAAIETTDTVNVALGKLEKAIEATGGDALTHVTAGNGIDVTNKADHNQTISVKIDTASEKFGGNAVLTAGADGLKISGIADKISAEINKLDYSDAAVANQYVSSVSETNGKIAVTHTDLPVIGVADGDKILSLSSSKIGAGLSIKYNSDAKKIYLYGSAEDEAHKIGEVDCTDFIKDGMLESATYSDTAKELTLTFNTDAGKTPIKVNLSDLVDTYKAGDGLTLDDTITEQHPHPTFKINLDGSSYLTIAGGKLHFDDTTIHSKITSDIDTKVNALNAVKSNTADGSGSKPSSQIKVQVSEAAGVLTGVTVTAPVFAEPGDLNDLESKLIGSSEKDSKESNTIWGAKKYADDKAAAGLQAAKDYTDAEIVKLDATVEQNKTLTNTESTGIKAKVTEVDGKLTGVEVSIAPNTYAKPADITTAINDLDAIVSNAAEAGTASTQIKVTVTETNGIITAVGVNAPAFDLSGAATTAQTNAKTYTDSAIQALDATVSQAADAAGNATGLALQVVQTDGKLTSVSGSMNWCRRGNMDSGTMVAHGTHGQGCEL